MGKNVKKVRRFDNKSITYIPDILLASSSCNPKLIIYIALTSFNVFRIKNIFAFIDGKCLYKIDLDSNLFSEDTKYVFVVQNKYNTIYIDLQSSSSYTEILCLNFTHCEIDFLSLNKTLCSILQSSKKIYFITWTSCINKEWVHPISSIWRASGL